MASPPSALPSPGLGGARLEAIERWAWRIPLPTRRLLLLLAVAVGAALVLSGVVGAAVLSRNSDAVHRARTSGVGVAQSATEFRTQLAVADAQAAVTLLSGGLEEPADRAAYDKAVLDASTALTAAATLGRPEDTDDILQLSEQLVRFNGSVETSRANSRQGYPVGSAYLSQARELARTEMVPRADRLRREGERRVAQAANDISGPVSAVGVAAVAVATVLLLAAATIVAGRTRRLVHPAIAVAAVAILVALAVILTSVGDQTNELRSAATDELETFAAANDASSALSNLRVTEINAVAARGSGDALFAQFRVDADALRSRLLGQGSVSLVAQLDSYTSAVRAVEDADTAGDNQAAAALTLTGDSGNTFDDARRAAAGEVAGAQEALTSRVDAADDASRDPVLLIVFGVVAAALAAAGILARARRYR